MKRSYLQRACEEIDATIFGGDVMYDTDTSDREALREYIARWNRELAIVDAADVPHLVKIEGLFTNSPKAIMSDGSVIHSSDGIEWTTKQP